MKTGVVTKLIIWAVFLIGFTAPFTHIFYNKTDVPGPFAFKKMVSFLFAIGFPVFLVCLSYLLYLASTRLEKELRTSFKLFSILTSSVGFFFLVWAFLPQARTFGNDFSPILYYGIMILISIMLSVSLHFLHKYFDKTIDSLGRMVFHLVKFANNIQDRFIDHSNLEEYKNEKIKALSKGAGLE